MKKINLISDLHLDASNCTINTANADYLVIAGDLATEKDLIYYFFERVSPKDIPIIYVLGNHEFEYQDIDTYVIELKKLLSDFPNVHILDNESIVLDGIKFIGTTLWSNFELDGLDLKKEAMIWSEENIVDFHHIYKKENGKYRTLTAKDMLMLNEKACNFLTYELLKNNFSGKKVVVTHFAPHLKSVHDDFKDTMSSYWVNNLENLLGFSDYWFHGHTHNSFEYNIEGTIVACNPRGYSRMYDLSSNKLYRKDKCFEVEPLNNNTILNKRIKKI